MRGFRSGYHLAPHVRIDVRYQDGSYLGAASSHKLQDKMRRLLRPIYQADALYGPEYVVNFGPDLLLKCFIAPTFEHVCGARYPNLSKSALFPDADSIHPLSLVFTSAESDREVEFDAAFGDESAVGDLLAELSGAADVRSNHRLHETFRELTDTLAREGFMTDDNPGKRSWHGVDATFLGHNTVAVRSARSSVLVDPWFFPEATRYPRDYQPIQPSALGPVDAVLITHSHPDHFDPGSLIRLNPRTPIVLPKVTRETLLTVDMKTRCRQLGFRSVKELEWWKTVAVGDMRVTALPFHGEQPTSGKRLYPEIRNLGNCYLIRTPRFACAVIADCGHDLEGSVKDVALESYERYGPIDVLFSGYRGWSLYPVQYFESSVRQYLLFVPPELFGVRQSIMNTVDDAIDTAEAWHSKYLTPYADGGAPWHAEIGLGPSAKQAGLDGTEEWAYFDISPERCLTALRRRAAPIPGVIVGSPVRPLLLHPGQSIKTVRGTTAIWEASADKRA